MAESRQSVDVTLSCNSGAFHLIYGRNVYCLKDAQYDRVYAPAGTHERISWAPGISLVVNSLQFSLPNVTS